MFYCVGSDPLEYQEIFMKSRVRGLSQKCLRVLGGLSLLFMCSGPSIAQPMIEIAGQSFSDKQLPFYFSKGFMNPLHSL